ncbi:MAG: hydantoinase/oxoprolinase family protein, partial [Planctomycetales bacterium]|nr:hydantoinase/oxoprolinase family protein [Planctomycetales bacterium]
QAAFARDAEMAGVALRVPMLDIHTVGAGGGSIAWIDAGGALRVGPQSAGAVSGPPCDGERGTRPTVTDANVLLGRLSGHSPLAGGLQLDIDAARRVIHDHLAQPLGLSVDRAAEGVIQVVNTTMTAAIRKLTVERGHDPREFVLCPFGGAGPLHASELARELGVGEVIVPAAPGVFSADGLLRSQLREDRVQSFLRSLGEVSSSELFTALQTMQEEPAERLREAAGETSHSISTLWQVGLRYAGQGHELTISLSEQHEAALQPAQLAEAFHAAHEQAYGFRRDDEPVELVNLWVSVSAAFDALPCPNLPTPSSAPQPLTTRPVVFDGQRVETPIYRREQCGPGNTIAGPAIIEQDDSTVVIWIDEQACVDRAGNLIITKHA